jgi:hypothetical protein
MRQLTVGFATSATGSVAVADREIAQARICLLRHCSRGRQRGDSGGHVGIVHQVIGR